MTNHTIYGRRMHFVTCSIHESLHNLGDFAHGQDTEFDPSDDNAPGRYSWAIHPDDAWVIICRDNVTDVYKAGQIDKHTQWVAEFIREALNLAGECHDRRTHAHRDGMKRWRPS
jgi:hypothetical protein